jgi:hypothetical protein
MTKTIEEILVPKPEVRLRVYAYSIDDEAHQGLLKVGQTTRDVRKASQRVRSPSLRRLFGQWISQEPLRMTLERLNLSKITTKENEKT